MKWRARLLVWMLRRLAPEGILTGNVPIEMTFSSGQSRPDNPKLCMHLTASPSGQPIISIVLPDNMLEMLADSYRKLHYWSLGGAEDPAAESTLISLATQHADGMVSQDSWTGCPSCIAAVRGILGAPKASALFDHAAVHEMLEAHPSVVTIVEHDDPSGAAR